VKLWARLAISAGMIASPVSCSCSESKDGAPHSADASVEETGVGGGGGSDGSEDSKSDADATITCSGGPRVPGSIPSGWKRFPGLPCDCDVWIAPESSLMDPKPKWVTTPPGVLELENNWADETHRIYTGTVVGDSSNGVHQLGFLRDLGNDLQEVVALQLPDDIVTFQARIPGGFLSNCSTRIQAIGQKSSLQFAWHSVADALDSSVMTVDAPAKPIPEVVLTNDSPLSPDQYAVNDAFGALLVGSRIDILWIADKKLDVGVTDLPAGWGTIDMQLSVSAEMVFFDLAKTDATTTVRPATWVWQPGEQARPLLELSGTGPGQVGTSCGASTDEKDFVWTQYSDWNGFQWNSIDIMTAPYTKDLSTLAPKKLRSAPGGSKLGGCSRWKVQAGYAATFEHSANDTNSDYRAYVVRLSDGVLWEVPARPGRQFGIPEYITATELVYEEGIKLPSDAGVAENESWSIVRYPISLLGPGSPP
jgi:hypothetical protein